MIINRKTLVLLLGLGLVLAMSLAPVAGAITATAPDILACEPGGSGGGCGGGDPESLPPGSPAFIIACEPGGSGGGCGGGDPESPSRG